MRGFTLLVVCGALVAACGDSASDETTTTAAAAATTTTAAATTTTTAPDETADRIAAAQALAGSYEGEWRNLTFGSSGAAEAEIEVVGSVTTVTLVLGGNVFGVGSPGPVVMEFDLSHAPPYETTSGLFGEATVEIDVDGNLRFTAGSIESLGGMSLVVDGTVTADGFDLAYAILQADSSTFAEGIVTATRN